MEDRELPLGSWVAFYPFKVEEWVGVGGGEIELESFLIGF